MPRDRYDIYFKDAPEGRAFYPPGLFGRGYVVDAVAERRARRWLRRLPWFVGGYCVVVGAVQSSVAHDHQPWIIALGFVCMPIFVLATVRHQVGPLTPSKARMRASEFVEGFARVSSFERIALGFGFGAFLTLVGGLTLLLAHRDPVGVISALAGLFAGVWMLVQCSLVLRVRRRFADDVDPSPRLRQP